MYFDHKTFVFLFHIIFVAPFLMVLGKYHDHPELKKTDIWKLTILLAIGTLVYHIFLLYKHLNLIWSI